MQFERGLNQSNYLFGNRTNLDVPIEFLRELLKQNNQETSEITDFPQVEIQKLEKDVVDVRAKLVESKIQYEVKMADFSQLNQILVMVKSHI